jgi:hypothetical protein
VSTTSHTIIIASLPSGEVLLYLNMTIMTANDMQVMKNRRFNDNNKIRKTSSNNNNKSFEVIGIYKE